MSQERLEPFLITLEIASLRIRHCTRRLAKNMPTSITCGTLSDSSDSELDLDLDLKSNSQSTTNKYYKPLASTQDAVLEALRTHIVTLRCVALAEGDEPFKWWRITAHGEGTAVEKMGRDEAEKAGADYVR